MAPWPAESYNEEAMFTHSFHDAAACLLSMPIISKNMILEIERIIMTEKKKSFDYSIKAPKLVRDPQVQLD